MLRMSFNSFRLVNSASALITALAVFHAGAAGAQQQADVARRIADVASIALDEYAHGVTDGRIVLAEEFAEAQAFLEDALASADRLDPETRARVVSYLERLATGVAALEPAAELGAVLEELRRTLERAVGVPLDPLPTAPPSLARGAEVYERYCAQCHGSRGAGDGPMAPGLAPPPADLTDPALGASSPVEFFRKVNVGVAGTGMPGFGDRLTLDDRWSVSLYASMLRHPTADRERGRAVLLERCPECRLVVSDFSATARLSDNSLAGLLAGHLGRADSGVSPSVLAYARGAAALEELGGDPGLAAARAVRRSKQLVHEAAQLAEAGEREAAARRALDGYLAFEAIERAVRARNAGAAARVERAFSDYRHAAQTNGADVAAARGRVEWSLDQALVAVSASASTSVLFAQSFIILLREGLEAILIIGALMAVLTKAGAPERKRDVGWGVVVALGLSAATAAAFATVLRSSARHQEAIEGFTMLLAAAMLFWVSYWLVSKIELRKWMAFVRTQVTSALTSGRGWALGAVAFLAVYREGFETVLFYAALFSTAEGAAGAVGAVVGGMLAGAVLLGVVYLLMQRYGVRLPLKPFFAVTSGLLYVMAFGFAGKGVAELQAAGLISVTPLQWLPAVPFLGIFPTLQTALSQLLLAVALLAALLWVFWMEPRASESRAA